MSIKSERMLKKRNQPPAGQPWVWFTRELLESEAFRTLSLAARNVLDRVIVEHMAHAGLANGELIVTYTDFERFGIRRGSIKKAINALTERGLLIVTEKGRPSTGPDRWPSRYAIGWLPMSDAATAINRWKAWRETVPTGGNIESSDTSATRKNRRNPRPLLSHASLAHSDSRATGETQKSAVA